MGAYAIVPTMRASAVVPKLEHQEWDTALQIEEHHATILVDLETVYPPGTTIYKYPSLNGGKKNVLTTVGPAQFLSVWGIVAAVNPDAGNNIKMQAISFSVSREEGLSGVAWIKYGGLKALPKNYDPGNYTLRRDEKYAPRISMNEERIVATYDRAHVNTIDSPHPIGGNQILVGEAEFVSTG
jgi:hypothetical protein